MNKLKVITLIVSLMLALPNAWACISLQPDYPVGGAYYIDLPLIPAADFLKGRIGTLNRAELGDFRLLIAYRYLQNTPLQKDEQTAVLSNWAHFNLLDQGYQRKQFENFAQAQAGWQKHYQDYLTWRTTRLQVLGQSNHLVLPPPPTPTPTKQALSAAEQKNAVGDYSNRLEFFYLKLADDEDKIAYDTLAALPAGFNFLVFATLRLKEINQELMQQRTLPSAERISLLKHWIAVQQALFAKRSHPEIQIDFTVFPTDLPPLLKADIAYMQAVNDFISDDLARIKQAVTEFSAVAENNHYPWASWARYMQYRALNVVANRAATTCDQYHLCEIHYGAAEQALLQKALEGMQQLAAQNTDPAIKLAVEKYIPIIQARLPGYYNKLLAALQHHIDYAAFNDFIYLTRSRGDKAIEDNLNKPAISDLQQWLLLQHQLAENTSPSMQSGPIVMANIFKLNYKHWRANPQHLAWLWLGLLAHNGADNKEELKQMIKAALAIKATAPGYFSLRAAIYVATENKPKLYFKNLEGIKDFIEETAAQIKPQDGFFTRYYWQDKQLRYADSINALLSYSFLRHSDWDSSLNKYANQYDYMQYNSTNVATLKKPAGPGYFVMPHANLIINRLPLSFLINIADSPLLPARFRPAFYASVWERAYLLEDKATAKQLENKVAVLNPALKPYLDAIYASADQDEQTRQFLTLLLHFPTLSPVINLTKYADWRLIYFQQSSGDSFYPVTAQPAQFSSVYNDTLWYSRAFAVMETYNIFSLLTDAQQQQWLQEQRRLLNLDDGAAWVALQITRLAQAHPNDPRYAELLVLAIKATQFSDKTEAIHKASKAAFLTLHKLYPNTKWAKETPYYF